MDTAASGDPDWAASAAPLQAELQALWPGLQVRCVEEVASTNSELLARAQQGRVEAQLLAARVQTAGRGRQGKTWWAEPGGTLTFSLALPLRPPDWSGLSLAVGLAVAEAFAADCGDALALKWPNDLWLRAADGSGRKLGGVLIETTVPTGQSTRVAVIGVGLNIAAPTAAPAAGAFATGYACLQEHRPDLTPVQALRRVAPVLLQTVRRFEQHGFAPLRAAYLARDLLAGRRVQAGAITGVAAGVNEAGLLLVHTDSGQQSVSSGEVSVRPC